MLKQSVSGVGISCLLRVSNLQCNYLAINSLIIINEKKFAFRFLLIHAFLLLSFLSDILSFFVYFFFSIFIRFVKCVLRYFKTHWGVYRYRFIIQIHYKIHYKRNFSSLLHAWTDARMNGWMEWNLLAIIN